MFNQHADRIVEAARAFEQLVANYSDLHLREQYNRDVDNAERAADRVTHDVNRLIHKTFITPIDREQIHKLINTMDDVADLIQDSAETMALYDVRHMTDEITRLTDLSVKCCERVQGRGQRASARSPTRRRPRPTLKTCEEIDRLESDADRVMRSAMSKLFREEPDVREVIKLKAIYELLETHHRQVRGRRQRDRGHRPRELLRAAGSRCRQRKRPCGWWSCWSRWRSPFDFMNGFHDAANSIATVVSTGVLKPGQAVVFAAFFNLVAIFVFHLSVAATVGKGIAQPGVVDTHVVFGALVGAITWNLVTWYYGIPSSSSHALIGGIVGAVIAKAGAGALIAAGHLEDGGLHLRLAAAGLPAGLADDGAAWPGCSGAPRRRAWTAGSAGCSWSRAGAYSLGHGGNDAQKTIGIIWMLLIATGYAAGRRRVRRRPGPSSAATPPSRWAPCSAAGASSRPWARRSPSSSRSAASAPRPAAR